MSTNSAPGYAQKPDHRVTTQPALLRVQVKLDGEVIADTQRALELQESNHQPVYYIPREDVKMQRLVRSSKTSYCPFKGTASYYSFANGAQDAVWSYEAPYDEMLAIKGLLAFYPNKADIQATGAA